jgi:MFS family permease
MEHPMSVTTSQTHALPMPSVVIALLPLIAVVLVIFLVTGLAIPALPLHVHERLGLGTFVVGLVSGTQFAASLISRVWSGRYADRRGAKRTVVAGLIAAAVSGLLLSSHWRSPTRRQFRLRSCCSAGRCWAAPKASSSPVP